MPLPVRYWKHLATLLLLQVIAVGAAAVVGVMRLVVWAHNLSVMRVMRAS